MNKEKSNCISRLSRGLFDLSALPAMLERCRRPSRACCHGSMLHGQVSWHCGRSGAAALRMNSEV